MAFPQFVPWIAGAWLAGCGFSIVSNRASGDSKQAGFCLLICIAALLIKQPGWSTPFVVFLIGCGLLSIVCFSGHSYCFKIVSLLSVLGLFGWFVAARWLDANCIRQFTIQSERPVVCLGDSLTEFGYPDELQQLISAQVVNFGQNGLTAERGIRKLPEIIALNPQVVIVELGGHDYKDGKTRRQTRAWLVEIIKQLEAADAQVILVEIPRGFISDPYAGLERELCRDFDLQLIPDTVIRRFIFWSPIIPPGAWFGKQSWLSEDGLHPNENGNQLLASYAANALTRLYGEGIIR